LFSIIYDRESSDDSGDKSGREEQFLVFYTSLSARSDRKSCNVIGFFTVRYYANYFVVGKVVGNFMGRITKFGVLSRAY